MYTTGTIFRRYAVLHTAVKSKHFENMEIGKVSCWWCLWKMKEGVSDVCALGWGGGGGADSGVVLDCLMPLQSYVCLGRHWVLQCQSHPDYLHYSILVYFRACSGVYFTLLNLGDNTLRVPPPPPPPPPPPHCFLFFTCSNTAASPDEL